MKALVLFLGFSLGALAHAAPCFRGEVNGSEISGLMRQVYTLSLTLPTGGASGKMSVSLGSNEIASTPVYRESDAEFGFENYKGLFRVERAGNALLIKVNGGILNANDAGELHLLRKKGDSHVYGLQVAQACR